MVAGWGMMAQSGMVAQELAAKMGNSSQNNDEASTHSESNTHQRRWPEYANTLHRNALHICLFWVTAQKCLSSLPKSRQQCLKFDSLENLQLGGDFTPYCGAQTINMFVATGDSDEDLVHCKAVQTL